MSTPVRRAIIVLASTLPPFVPRAAWRANGQGAPLPPAGKDAPRLPVFCLTGPLPRQGPRRSQPEVWPRISLLDCALPLAAPALPVRPRADEAVIAARLLRRLFALEIAYIDPIAQARRFLRRRARAAAKGGPPKPPISFLRIPGHTRHLLGAFRAVLEDMNTAAFSALMPAPDSS